jgi:MFS family permease
MTFAWMTWEVTRDPMSLAYLGMAQGVPLVLLQLFGGVLADRINRLRLLVVTQVLIALTLSIAFALTLSGQARLDLLLVLAALTNSFRAFGSRSRSISWGMSAMRLGSSNARKVLPSAASTSRWGTRTSPMTVNVKATISVAEVMIVVPRSRRRRLVRSARTPARSWKTTSGAPWARPR